MARQNRFDPEAEPVEHVPTRKKGRGGLILVLLFVLGVLGASGGIVLGVWILFLKDHQPAPDLSAPLPLKTGQGEPDRFQRWSPAFEGDRTISAVAFASAPDLVLVSLGRAFPEDEGARRHLHWFDVKQGKARTTHDTRSVRISAKAHATCDVVAVSTDGDYCLVATSRAVGDTYTLLAEKKPLPVFIDWEPKHSAPEGNDLWGGNANGANWLAPGKLVVYHRNGAAEVWELPERKQAPLLSPLPGGAERPVSGFAMSHDRKQLVRWEGTTFQPFTLPDAKPLPPFETITLPPAPDRVSLESAVFSPDNKFLAALIEKTNPKTPILTFPTDLVVWSTQTGKKLVQVPAAKSEKDTFRRKLAWWGTEHVILGTVANLKTIGVLVAIPTGQSVCQVLAGGVLTFANTSATDGKVWLFNKVPHGITDRWELLCYDFPTRAVGRCRPVGPGEKPVSVILLGPDGLETR